MRAFVFTEMQFPFVDEDAHESVRVTLPNNNYDPQIGHELYKRYFDLYERADRYGLDIMLNEHHSTATCVEPAVPLTMSILARTTKSARILALGNPVANRRDPVRIAEEMAMIDVISGGRAEVGFVRGVAQEISPANSNPVLMKERMWEAVDLIIKAWTTHDGPFSWEGEFFHQRQVNIWPRPLQQPHPPIWVPTQTASTARETAQRGYTVATILNGAEGCVRIFDAYRESFVAAHGREAPTDNLAYLGLVFVAKHRRDALEGARAVQWYIQHNKVAPQFINVPGYFDAATRVKMLRAQYETGRLPSPIDHLAWAPIEELVDGGFCFAGEPEEVAEQLLTFRKRVGGFDNWLALVQAGAMETDFVAPSMELMASEVLPIVNRELAT
jgi:alkanesulfonate monooxygenase SsuD/methylene tetrahydromethanopterin reductase-like flavin-dependent oxidoreductase (luciferase family)